VKSKMLFLLQMLLLLPIMPLLGAIKVKGVAESTTKWSENAGRAAAEFATNAEAAASDWQSKTIAAAANFHQAITAPGIKERFAKGVQRAGASKFARKIRDVGMNRFAPGVAAATVDYTTGVEPFFSTIAALTLSARKPRGDPANYRRVEEVGKALNAKRLALLGVAAGGAGG